MNHRRLLFILGLVLTSAWLATACGGQAAAPTVDVDAAVQTALAATRLVETQIAQAVQATLQASAPTPATAPTATLAPLPTATPLPPAPTNMPPAAAAPTQPPPATTPTRIRIAESDVDGSDPNDFLRGSSNSNNGRVILLPGFEQSQVTDTPAFRDFINFRVEVFDTRAGLVDGAGIQELNFRIDDEQSGETVWEKQEIHPAFCVFGGDDPSCSALDLRANARWPDPFGGQIRNGTYLATIDITPLQGDATQWRWRFAIESPHLAAATPAPAANTARIDSISLQDTRYIVDFQTFGFTPLTPGQHVHFFFDTVPVEQAGTPGSGPWQLYPTGPGQPNTSPFSLLTIYDRPPGAAQLCILVANPDHSVIPNTGNCVLLPG